MNNEMSTIRELTLDEVQSVAGGADYNFSGFLHTGPGFAFAGFSSHFQNGNCGGSFNISGSIYGPGLLLGLFGHGHSQHNHHIQYAQPCAVAV